MAAIAKEKGIPIEIGTFESWDPAERRFDLVVFGSSFHWVNPDIAFRRPIDCCPGVDIWH